MATWRYVVSCTKAGLDDELGWEIRELYDGEGDKFSYTSSTVKPYANSFSELLRDLEHMRRDANLEILDLRSDEPKLVPLEKFLEEPPSDADADISGVTQVADEGQPPIFCICGSTRFRDEMADANRRLTLAGAIVVAPAVFQHAGDSITDAQKEHLDNLHLRKIDLADAVFVVDPGGYIGESTRREIAYGRTHGKPVFRLSALDVSMDDLVARIGGTAAQDLQEVLINARPAGG